MRLSHFFIDRPIFATVLSVLIILVGLIAYTVLPVSQFPDVVPPTVIVRAQYPGASPETIAATIATPIEQEVNGVENMLYMESSSTSDGVMQLTVTFALGTNLDQAQVNVQNRVALAEPRLPEEVRRIGVTARKNSPDMLMVIHLTSPDNSRSQLYISNFAVKEIRDELSRIDGVGDIRIFGEREYSMRVWLDIEKMAALDLTAGDVVAKLREQNVQVAAGAIGEPPVETPGAFKLTVAGPGRLVEPKEFEEVIVKDAPDGRLVRLRDVAQVQLGAVSYATNSYLDGSPAVGLAVFQLPGTNAVETVRQIKERMTSFQFPAGVEYQIAYNPTDYVEQSVNEVFNTLWIASLLVVLTVYIFLQSWRTTIVPLVAIPVSLIGTFAIMFGLGFSLNTLSLFGLVLAIGIVVDDAIVVVENCERLINEGLPPREATKRAMDEVGSALIATTLVLIAVFVPTSFLPGISGQFYRQFAVTVAVSTAISTLVSLTLSPAMCALFLRPKSNRRTVFTTIYDYSLGLVFGAFNWTLDKLTGGYVLAVRNIIRLAVIFLFLYAGLVFLTGWSFQHVPTGFIPDQDQGYLIVSVQLPDAASLDRTDAVIQEAGRVAREIPGIAHTVQIVGFSGATRANSSNAGAIFVLLDDANKRPPEQSVQAIVGQLSARMMALPEAQIFVIPPPPIRGLGTGGGFKFQIEDRRGYTLKELEEVTNQFVAAANARPEVTRAFANFRTTTPQLSVTINRERAQMLNVPLSNIFDTLQVSLGSSYINDFNFIGRTYRVTAQAHPRFRESPDDITRLRTRSTTGAIVPLGSLVNVETITAPDRVVRYQLYPSADIQGTATPGYSTGQALAAIDEVAQEVLPNGMVHEWTDIAYQERAAGNTAVYIFPLCVLFVFLTLSAQYESWILPLAVILIVPLCLLFGLGGVMLRGMDNNIFTQIALVVLVGLACKNAILIVEFAKDAEAAGHDPITAALDACRLRLRAILMTAFSFVLGVIPLVIATGAGFEIRRVIGTTVFAGMVGVTILGLFLTPLFYVVLRRMAIWVWGSAEVTPSMAGGPVFEPPADAGPGTDNGAAHREATSARATSSARPASSDNPVAANPSDQGTDASDEHVTADGRRD